MSSFNLKLNPEQIQEMPLVDLAYEILKKANTPYYYRDLMNEIAEIRGLGDKDINRFIAQVYTEINIDGRFACVGNNIWGLKRWYPVEKAEDPLGNAKRTRIINDEDDLEDEDDLFVDEEDSFLAEEEDNFTGFGERDEFEDGEEDTADEEVEIEDEMDETEISLEEVEEEEYEDFDDEEENN